MDDSGPMDIFEHLNHSHKKLSEIGQMMDNFQTVREWNGKYNFSFNTG